VSPRVLEDSVHPRRLSNASVRPLNFTVRQMSTGTTHRLIELLVGFALLGYCAYELYTGHARGAYRSYNRYEQPGSYWTSMLLKLAITAAFLVGFTRWRD
ncbi:MAG TPA: hypothetical protein VEY89_00530, partial [Candidatus Dormibacteraeota bacterium]|nr:hypothetical protein [Candidatus Dormibacteraeota bacterium]